MNNQQDMMDPIRFLFRCRNDRHYYHLHHDENNQSHVWYGAGSQMINFFNLPSGYEIIHNISTAHPTHSHISSLYDDLADVVVLKFVMTHKRFQFMDYGYPLDSSTTVIFRASQAWRESDPLETVFSRYVWYAFIFSFFISVIVAMILRLAERDKFDTTLSLIQLLGVPLRQGISGKLQSGHAQLHFFATHQLWLTLNILCSRKR